MNKSISNAIKYLVSLSIIFSTPYVFSDTGANLSGYNKQYINNISLENPLLGEFVNDKPLDDKFKTTFKRNSTFLDSDPFFLNSQKWTISSTHNNSSDTKVITVITSSEKTLINIPGRSTALELAIGLTPVIETDDYLIFSLSSQSSVFDEKDPENSSEGLFYISKTQLFNSQQISETSHKLKSSSAVQVNFFPLPGHGWMGELESFESEQNLNYIIDQELGKNLISFGSINTGSLVIYNNNDNTPLVIELADIEEHEKHMKLNLTLARMVTLEGERSSKIEDFNINPANGTTAAFGNFITGINLESSTSSYWAKSNFDKLNLNVIQPALDTILPKAHASFGLESIDPEVVQRLLFVGKLVGSTFVGALALKYSIYRDRYKKLYEHKIPEDIKKKGIKGLFQIYIPEESKIKVNPQAGFLKRLAQSVGEKLQPAYNIKPVKLFRNEVKGVFDVYAHSLVAVVKTMPITIINVIEYLQDRYASNLAASKNSMIRKSFNATFGWTRGTMKDLAVSHKTWWLGSIVMGTVDTALVVLQLLFLVPAITNKIEGDSAVADANSVDIVDDGIDKRSAKSEFVISEIIRNITGYFNSGAYGYSHEQKLIYNDRVENEVDTAYRKKGIDPKSKDIQDEREKLIKDKLDNVMVRKGLPGKDEFLFDAISLTRNTTKKLGYSATALGVSPETSGKFIFEHGRWGLMFPALNNAIRSAKKIESESPSTEGQKVIALLESIKSRKSRLSALVKQGLNIFSSSKRNYFKEAKEVRQLLTLLSFGDDISKVSSHLPKWYSDLATDSETALSAARIYSLSLLSIVEGNKSYSESDLNVVNTVNKHFSLRSIEDLNEKNLTKELGLEAAGKLNEIKTQHDTNNNFSKKLMEIKSYKAIYDAIGRKKEVLTYKPKKESLLRTPVVSTQKHIARKRTENEILKEGISISSKEGQAKYNTIYSKHMANIVGLSIYEDTEFIKAVHKETDEQAKVFMETEEQVQHLSTLDFDEAVRYESEAYASIFLDTYISKSVHSDDYLKAKSPQQPGFFQKLRKRINRNNDSFEDFKAEGTVRGFKKKLISFSNVSLRAVESLWSTESNKLGLIHMIDRRIPLAHDTWRNFARNLKTIPMGLTFGYLIAYNVWQVKMDYSVWVLFMATSWTVVMMVEANNRYMQNIGKKPMGSTFEKIWYAVIHSMLTFPAYIPIMLWADPFNGWWSEKISKSMGPKIDSATNALASLTDSAVSVVANHPMQSLGAAGTIVATKLATDAYKNSKNKKILAKPLSGCAASLN